MLSFGKIDWFPKRRTFDMHPWLYTASLFACVCMFIACFIDLYTYAGADQWPNTKGEMLTGEIHEIDFWPVAVPLYRLALQYRYEVADTIYINEKIQVGLENEFETVAEAMRILEKYQESPSLTVYYSESDPAVSILQPNPPPHTDIKLKLSVVGLSILAILTLVAWLKRSRRPEDTGR